MSADDHDSIGKGTFVNISGLKSDKGKRLNGGHGFVVSDESISNNGTRYPVLIFAIPNNESGSSNDDDDYQILTGRNVIENQVKVENLTVEPNPGGNTLISKAIWMNTLAAQKRNDKTKLMFWLEIYYKHWSDDYPMSITYANLLRDIQLKTKESLTIMGQLKETVPTSYEKYNEFCHDYCVACCAAEESFSDALELALKIPTDSEAGKNMLFGALDQLRRTCNHFLQEDTNLEKDPEVASVHVRCTKIAFERKPSDLGLLVNLGAAYCLAGDNVQGAKCYRRALAGHCLDQLNYETTKTNLIQAQLQCPGMPLENFYIVVRQGTMLVCLAKEDRDKVRIVARTHGNQKLSAGVEAIQEGVQFVRHEMPTDPDDRSSFPPSLIEMLNSP